MITRESLAAVLDPFAWSEDERYSSYDWQADIPGRREHSLEAADRLLSNPRYAALELPEPDGDCRWQLPVPEDLHVRLDREDAESPWLVIFGESYQEEAFLPADAVTVGVALIAAARTAMESEER